MEKGEEREKEDAVAGVLPKANVEDVAGAEEAPNRDVEPNAGCDAGCDWPNPPKLKPLPVLLLPPNEPNDMAATLD